MTVEILADRQVVQRGYMSLRASEDEGEMFEVSRRAGRWNIAFHRPPSPTFWRKEL
jgi:hypothetical protein